MNEILILFFIREKLGNIDAIEIWKLLILAIYVTTFLPVKESF